jgi:hypothetical protein
MMQILVAVVTLQSREMAPLAVKRPRWFVAADTSLVPHRHLSCYVFYMATFVGMLF